MKRALLFTFVLFCISYFSNAQAQNYYSIFENQKQWDLKVEDYASGQIVPVTQSVVKDTNVAGQSLILLAESIDMLASKGILISEDATVKKVYVVDNNEKFLLYDFSLVKGDQFSLKDLQFQVLRVDQINLNGSWRKQIELQCTSKLADNLVWIEGLGSTVSPLYYKNYADPKKIVKVACMFKGDLLEYSLSDQQCSRQLFSADNKEYGFGIVLSPNPFGDQIRLNISNPADEEVTIKLFDITGQLIYQEELLNPGQQFEKRLTFPGLVEGVYFLNTSTIRNQMTQKVIKY